MQIWGWQKGAEDLTSPLHFSFWRRPSQGCWKSIRQEWAQARSPWSSQRMSAEVHTCTPSSLLDISSSVDALHSALNWPPVRSRTDLLCLLSRPGHLVLSPSVQFSCSVMSDSLWPHGLQHARPPCPSPTPAVCSNSCPSSWWHHLTISSSVVPFSSCLQSFPASRSLPMSQFFTSCGQSVGVSASASVLPMNIQG